MVSHLASFDLSWVGYGIIILFIAIFLLKGIRIIRPTHDKSKDAKWLTIFHQKDFAFLFFVEKLFCG